MDLTKDNEAPPINKAVQASPGMSVGGWVSDHSPFFPTELTEVAAIHPPHVVVARPGKDPQPAVEHRRKMPAHHFGR